MLGRSIYLSSSTDTIEKTLSKIKDGDWIFTSLHSFEDFVEDYAHSAQDLIDAITKCGGKVVADVSPDGITKLGFNNLVDLAKSGSVHALRLDYGFSTDEMFEAAKYCKIVLNASVLDHELIDKLSSAEINIVGMHNFYPRVDSGLDESFALKCTDYLHKHNGESWAFISGDEEKREPIYEGLPTVEDYRYMHPYVQYELLTRKLNNDVIFLGDISLKTETEKMITTAQENNAVVLPIELAPDYNDNNNSQAKTNFNKLINVPVTIRSDSNSRIARIQESRSNVLPDFKIEPCNCIERTPGDITIDNTDYQRYCGEIQIIRKPLPQDKRVNIIAEIKEPFLPLLQTLDGGTRVIFTN